MQNLLIFSLTCLLFKSNNGFSLIHNNNNNKLLTRHNQIHGYDSKNRISGIASISSSSSSSNKVAVSNTQLNAKLWDRMQIEEDPEPFWYLINCVAGLEMDLLYQCRAVCADMEDAVKFVVPTEIKTRSHGARKIVTEKKVKYQGYVFGKLRLCPEVYETIQELDLCRSWMGTINYKGYKKLPPSPQALSEEEIENFGLEDVEYEEEEDKTEYLNNTLLVDDDVEDDDGEDDPIMVQQKKAMKQYLDIKVEDMVKITAKGKFFGEDGIVRRLKGGKIMVRFYTYGTMYEDWLDPGDMRVLTNEEMLRGLSGPTEPITQLDTGNDRGGYRENRRNDRSLARNAMSNVRGMRDSGSRNRRQDRYDRGDQYNRGQRDIYGRTAQELAEGRQNWKEYKDKQKQTNSRSVSDDDWQYTPSNRKPGDSDWAIGDVDSQWGRQNRDTYGENRRRNEQQQSQKRERTNEDDEDWSALVSPASSIQDNSNESGSDKVDDDDFFTSLMEDLSKDIQEKKGNSNKSKNNKRLDTADNNGENDNNSFAADNSKTITSEEDDFFASLMSELEADQGDDYNDSNKDEEKSSNNVENEPLDDEEFFESLAMGDDSDFFTSLEQELGDNTNSEVNHDDSNENAQIETTDDVDDFFASLEAEISSPAEVTTHDLTEDTTNGEESEIISRNRKSTNTLVAEPKSAEKTLSSSSNLNAADLAKLTVPKLKDLLRERGLKVSGKKAELIDRLT